MPLDPRVVFWSKCELIQRDAVADLPPLNGSSSPKAGTFCWVSEMGGQLWLAISDPNASPNLNTWVLIGPSGPSGAVLPDLRFVVARRGYGGPPVPGTLGDIAPFTTYTDVNTAVAFSNALAAAAAYRAILQALPDFVGLNAKCSVILHPDVYAGRFSIPDGVTVQGLGAAPSDTLVGGIDLAPTQFGNALRNISIIGTPGGASVSVSPASGMTTVHISDVETPDSTNPVQISGIGTSVYIDACQIGDLIISGSAVVSSENSRIQRVDCSDNSFYVSSYDRISDDDQLSSPVIMRGAARIRMTSAQIRSRGPQAFSPFSILGSGECYVSRSSVLGTGGLPAFDISLAQVGASVRYRGIETEDASAPLLNSNPVVVVAPLANDEAEVVATTIINPVLPVGFTLSLMPADGRDVDQVSVSYPSTPSNLGPYAIRVMPDARLYAPGRKIVVSNVSQRNDPSSGPIALATAVLGQTIDDMSSVVPPVSVTSQSYIILAPGSHVELYVKEDRTGYLLR